LRDIEQAVNATHATAPEVASDQVVEWVKEVLR
jgi:hypothetical protein